MQKLNAPWTSSRDQQFPMERVAIIGHDLWVVEQVTGRLNHGGAAPTGT
jgi:hypothetical protein